MSENDEILDLVDDADTVIGTIRRGDIAKMGYKSPDGYVRFAVGFIVNKNNQIWVPIRGLHKSIAPGGCDFSVAEHVLAGESYDQAIKRAFLEEAGMTIDDVDVIQIGKLQPVDDKPTHEAVFACILDTDDDLDYSKEEFTSASWMAIDAFEKLLINGPPTKTALLPAFWLLQAWLADR